MTGVTHLPKLLAGLEPSLHEKNYVFCSFKNTGLIDICAFSPLCTFVEAEGITAVLPENQVPSSEVAVSSAPMSCITITIHSSLEAVGLTAAMASELAQHGISANVVAAYYHDHVFVPVDRAADAINALRALQQRSLNS